MSTPDQALENFKILVNSIKGEFTEADTRVKIIDTIFKECLGWEEDDIRRETHIHKGFIDYIFMINDIPMFVLEAKKIGEHFNIPLSFRKRKYLIRGTITTEKNIKEAIDQVAKYGFESGTTYAIACNGKQFIIFECFRRGGNWRDTSCMLFKSFADIIDNFTLFWNILSKEAVKSGSLMKYISEKIEEFNYKRPLDYIHNENATVGKNTLAKYLTPLINNIFGDLTDISQIDILKKCYIRQKEVKNYDSILKTQFDKLPHYATKYDIDWFIENETSAGKFQLSFERCQEFLKNETPKGSLMILLGGIGSGKTTFIHHFFKVTMGDRKDILWFYVNFLRSTPKPEHIDEYIYESILEYYNLYYIDIFRYEFEKLGLINLKPIKEDIIKLFAILNYMGYIIALVLDNVDQHYYISPRYQEKVFEFAQYLTPELRTITILNLREESFFRATKSGVLDAYLVPKYHISSPSFENLIRKRLNYAINLLDIDENNILDGLDKNLLDIDKKLVKMFFNIINYSIRRKRRVGKDILEFINDISGGDMRQALRLFNDFMTSANTDIEEMLSIEANIPENAPAYKHYQIPLHHILKSMILSDNKYYGSNRSYFMNIFQLNPEYTNSHFLNLHILTYLNKRINYYIALDYGYVSINDILFEAEQGGVNQNAIKDSIIKLAQHSLIMYDNQDKEAFDTASYVKITQTGKYYIEKLIYNFTYLDIIFQDALISDENLSKDLGRTIRYDDIKNKFLRTEKRFERTEIFINYLKQKEQKEVANNPFLLNSDLTNKTYMNKIFEQFYEQKEKILSKLKNNT